jgi:hypothetical protein
VPFELETRSRSRFVADTIRTSTWEAARAKAAIRRRCGERPRPIAEELALQQALGRRRAVDHYELAPNPARPVQRSRNHLFAASLSAISATVTWLGEPLRYGLNETHRGGVALKALGVRVLPTFGFAGDGAVSQAARFLMADGGSVHERHSDCERY